MKDRKRNTKFQKSSTLGFLGQANLRGCPSPAWHPARSSLHTYSLGRERAKANREFEKLLLRVVSLAVGDLAPLLAPPRLGRVSAGPPACRVAQPSFPSSSIFATQRARANSTAPELPDSSRHYPLLPPFS